MKVIIVGFVVVFMDKETNFGVISIVLALIAILLSWKIDLLTVAGSVVIGSIAISFAYLSSCETG